MDERQQTWLLNILQANQGKEFVRRILDIQAGRPSPQIENADGSHSTHLMAESDNTAFPMIQQLPNQENVGGLLSQINGVSEREPYQSELDYFKSNPTVSGMATEDGRVIINPYSNLNDAERNAVRQNESARVLMRQRGEPSFSLTPEQSAQFEGTPYASASDTDRAATIAARLFSGDPSGKTPTPEQSAYVQQLRGSGGGLLTQFEDWRKALGSARQNNNAIDFNTPQEAGLFAQNYKHFWPKDKR